MIRGTVEVSFGLRYYEQGSRALRALAGLIRSQQGCSGCRLRRDLIDEDHFHFSSEWNSRDDLDNYIRSDLFRSLLSIMDLSSTPPVMKFETIHHVENNGMEYIAATRRPDLGKQSQKEDIAITWD